MRHLGRSLCIFPPLHVTAGTRQVAPGGDAGDQYRRDEEPLFFMVLPDCCCPVLVQCDPRTCKKETGIAACHAKPLMYHRGYYVVELPAVCRISFRFICCWHSHHPWLRDLLSSPRDKVGQLHIRVMVPSPANRAKEELQLDCLHRAQV